MDDIRLICGDCLEVLPTLADGSVDAVVTDPPYRIRLGSTKDKRHDGKHGLNRPAYTTYEDSPENILKVMLPALNRSLAVAKRGAVFSGPNIQDMPRGSLG